jgi:hypothetical protein
MGKDYLGKDMRRNNDTKEEKEEKEIKSLDEGDIALLKAYGQGQYSKALKQVYLLPHRILLLNKGLVTLTQTVSPARNIF